MDDRVQLDSSALSEFQKKLMKNIIDKFPDDVKDFLKQNASQLRKNTLKSARAQTTKKTGNYYKGFKISRAFVGKNGRSFVKTYNDAPHSHLIEYGHEKWIHGKDTGEKVKGKYILTAEAIKYASQYYINAQNFLEEYFETKL